MSTVLKGQIFPIEFHSLVYPGVGIGTLEGRRVECAGVLPGELVEVRIIKQFRTYFLAKMLSILRPSSYRSSALCSQFLQCGGCQILDVRYSHQLQLKQDMISAYIQERAPSSLVVLKPILPSSSAVYYRNKMDFSFCGERGNLILGLKKRGSFDEVVPVSDCVLQDPVVPDILAFTARFFSGTSLFAWDHCTHMGQLRYLVLRQSKSTGVFLATLVVSSLEAQSVYQRYSQELAAQFPMIETLCLGYQPQIGDTSFTTEYQILYGPERPFLMEPLCGLNFQISPTAFFQTNTAQAQVLYQTILELGQFLPQDRVFDLYCGTGTIGLCIAPYVRQVTGVEENKASIQDATQNAGLNQISNIEFFADNVKNFLKFDSRPCDVIVIDPPRDGLIPKALRRIIERNVPKIVYVSCNMNTLWRDLPFFLEAGYSIDVIQPVDMFPNTWHIETVVRLSK